LHYLGRIHRPQSHGLPRKWPAEVVGLSGSGCLRLKHSAITEALDAALQINEGVGLRDLVEISLAEFSIGDGADEDMESAIYGGTY
jgi:hypothetical protein